MVLIRIGSVAEMPITQITQKNRLIKVHSVLGEDVLLFKEMRAHESLGDLFHFDVTLFSTSGNISFEDILGTSLTVEMALPDGGMRYFNGIVCKFSQQGGHGRFNVYRASLRPWLWLLTRTTNCRIFQAKTVPEIVERLFRDYGFTDINNRLMEDYPKREYCVQYNESDFAFVSRLMEQEGIYYYFAHENGRHTLVLADSFSAHNAVPGYEQVPYFPLQKSLRRERDHLFNWQRARSVQPGAYALNDFDFQKSSANLNARRIAPAAHAEADYEMYRYPGGYHERDDGARYARVRLEAFQALHHRFEGEGNPRGLSAGTLFTLTRHPQDEQNREYLILAATHTLSLDNYETGPAALNSLLYKGSIVCIDSHTPYRAPCATPKPTIAGPQTATVVGKAGEALWTDEYGRVKVQFHWDRQGKRNENSSCWVRVSQSWAGNGWGGIHIPRIGQEVIVEFLNGDPDRPIITGRVYNGDNPVPYRLPANATQSGLKSRSSKGGGASNYNELRFEDKKGAEHIHLQAEKDYSRLVKNNEETEIQANHSMVIKNDHAMTITNASSHDAKTILIKATDSSEITIGGSAISMSPSSIDIDGSQITISGSATVTIKGGVIKLN